LPKPKLLIIEDDTGLCNQYRWAFPGYATLFAHNRQAALELAELERPPLAIIDLGLPPDPDGVTEGFATIEQLSRRMPEMKVVVATSHVDRTYALRAVAGGAYDFCDKPIEIEVLRTVIDRALRLYELEQENRQLSQAAASGSLKRIVTGSDAMLKVNRTIERVAPTNVTVLLLGESGTGKELAARAVHELSPRANEPFVAINCGAIPETLLESELFGYERGAFTGAVKQTIGKIEAANRGTLFLDEIGDLPMPLQVKLLRFLQEQTVERIGGRAPISVNVRVVSATNVEIEERKAQGTFRSDLFYRLNPLTVRMPPLRERDGDPMLLARFFLNRLNRELNRSLRGFTDAAAAAISAHSWPGNVRELENRVKRAVVMADGRLIDAPDLELSPMQGEVPSFDLRAARLRAEREVLQRALAHCNNRVSGTAKLLGVSRPTLYGLLEQHDLMPTKTSAVGEEDPS
jgi:two-component system NtrC family response regulator